MRKYVLGFILAGMMMMCVFGCSGRRPPGTVRVKYDGQVVYVDKNPICYRDYLEYLWSLEHRDSLSKEELSAFLPEGMTYPMFIKNHNIVPYKPLLNLSEEQKDKYAAWRSEVVREGHLLNYHKEVDWQYEVLSAEEYAELCRQNHRLKTIDNEEQMTRCIVRPIVGHIKK